MEQLENAEAVFLGLAKEITTDPELMVLTAGGLALASRSRLLRGMGVAMIGWYVTRKADTYMMVINSKMQLIASVMDAGYPKEVNEQETGNRAKG